MIDKVVNIVFNYYAAMGLLQIAGLRFQYQFGAVAFAAVLVFFTNNVCNKKTSDSRQTILITPK
jgi:hypothetical protein